MENKMNDTIQNGAMIATSGFELQSIQTTGSTVESIMAAREKALVEARLIVAMKQPRNWDDIRIRLLRAIERPGFAGDDEKKINPGCAWYKLPFGDSPAQGFSIRMAEECLREMGHIDARAQIIWEDDKIQRVQVTVFDYQSNTSIPTEITIEKTKERKYLKNGEIALSTRITSTGEVNYILPADERDMLQKQNAAISKAIRNGVMRLVPGDIQAELSDRILQIRHGSAATDPDGARKKIIDSFASLNVTPSELEEYLGHEIGLSTPAEIVHLRDLFSGIKEGKTTWVAVLNEAREERGAEPTKVDPKRKMDVLKDKLKNRQPGEEG
jgi:hypothetical protein